MADGAHNELLAGSRNLAMALFETTTSALDSASGSVLSSEALNVYTKSTSKLSKQPRGQASIEPNPKPKLWFRKGPSSCA